MDPVYREAKIVYQRVKKKTLRARRYARKEKLSRENKMHARKQMQMKYEPQNVNNRHRSFPPQNTNVFSTPQCNCNLCYVIVTLFDSQNHIF